MTAAAQTPMRPLVRSSASPKFFGQTERQLFGILHPAEGVAAHDHGVVLCYPGPQEYRHTHWAFRKLALLLAREGFPVLRFDYFGTGDSAGASDEGSLAQWVRDIRLAAQELRDASGVRRVSLVGMRLGAALAARACADGLRVRHLVLWEPVVRGSDYLAELDHVTRFMALERRFPCEPSNPPGDLVGFSASEAARAELRELDLLAEPWGAVDRVSILASEPHAAHSALRARLAELGLACSLEVVTDDAAQGGRQDQTLLSHQMLRAITSVVAGRQT